MDNTDDQWTEHLLRGLGLRISDTAVERIAKQVLASKPLHPLYQADGARVAGKATCQKVKELVNSGQLDPLLQYWGLKEVLEQEEDPIRSAHLAALTEYLRTNSAFRDSLRVMTPAEMMEEMTSQREGDLDIPSEGPAWESLPIISRIQAHCPQHPVWGSIEEFKADREEYYRSISHRWEQLGDGFERRLGFPAADVIIPGLQRRLLSDIFAWAAAQLLGSVHRQGCPCVETWKPRDREPVCRLAWGGFHFAEGNRERITSLVEVVLSMLAEWSNSDNIRSVVNQYHRLEFTGQRIVQAIGQIDETVLRQGTCPDCPNPPLVRKANG